MPAIGMAGQLGEVMLSKSGGKVRVTGTFDPGDDDVHKAKVLFLIVQGDGRADTVIVEGEAEWRRENGEKWTVSIDNNGVFPKPDDTAGMDNGTPDNSKARLVYKDKPKDRMVRGIALAIAIKPAKPATQLELKGRFNPPQIEALTWCVELALRQRGTDVTAQNGRKAARPGRKVAARRAPMPAN